MESIPIREIKGVGEKTEALFHRLKIYTVEDLLRSFPRTYNRYPDVTTAAGELEEGRKTALLVRVAKRPTVKRGKVAVTILRQEAQGGIPLECVWFRLPYLASTLKVGETFVFYGTLKTGKGAEPFFRLEQAEIYPPYRYAALQKSLQPVYSLTKGLSNTLVKKSIQEVLSSDIPISDYMPEPLLKKRALPPLKETFQEVHFPVTEEELAAGRRRLTYDEFFFFFLNLAESEGEETLSPNTHVPAADTLYRQTLVKLPYDLTEGQKAALGEIISDMKEKTASERLIQGDVGSGKTLVAFLAMLIMVENGYKALLMAPTEVLAEQHFETFKNYVADFALPFEVVLLTGAVTGRARKEVLAKIAAAQGIFIIGTSALISEAREYGDIGIVVTDEQHRFGVRQRKELMRKGNSPYVLVMSATPIPRTLAMILYQGMKISVMKDRPKNRLPIKNCVVRPDKRPVAYRFLEKEVVAGHQAYVICPFVEQSEDDETICDVISYEKQLKKALPGTIRIGLLHGRMKDEEKNAVMAAFGAREIDVLVSTTVIEVGIDVPNATVILIENADRFGLAQLHQLRGRVGRGDAQSYCIFMDCSDKKETPERLSVINSSNDGFFIAEEDLRLRGPGDVTGIRQSGAIRN